MPRLTDDQARERAAALHDWEFRGSDIRKQYRFAGFKDAMAFVGRTRVLERYTVDAMCVSTLDVYKKLIAHG